MNLTAHARTPSLLTSLSRAGWGVLAPREYQGVRATLRGLVDQLDHRSGQGWTTADQVSVSTGLSSRWTRHCMQVLEDLGVIVWHRGGVLNGAPTPSFVRIVKTVLLDLIRAARPVREEADREHRKATRDRLKGIRYIRSQRPRRSDHAELSASPPTPTGEVSTTDLPERTDMHPGFDSPVCEHGGDGRRMANGKAMCPMCRRRDAAQHAAEVGVTTKPRRRRRNLDILDYAALASGERAEDDE